MRNKGFNYKNGLGYCGWYTTIYNKNVFLRSLNEFLIARLLDSKNIPFLVEKEIYEINGKRYKPDFFIFENSSFEKLIKIIEVKDNKKESKLYLDTFSDYFLSKGIEYEVKVVDKRQKFYKTIVSDEEIKLWKENSKTVSMEGENNPMYGIKQSESTKKKIGNRTREYMKDPEIKKKHSLARRAFWLTEEGKKEKLHLRELRKEEGRKRRAQKEIENPIVEKTCVFCNKIFEDRLKSHKITCSASCIQKYNNKIGKRNYINNGQSKRFYKKRLLVYGKLIINLFPNVKEDDWEHCVVEVKHGEKIPLNFGISIKVIKNYFQSFDNFIKELRENGQTD